MMETMSLNPEQLYKPNHKKDEKPQLKLNLNLGMDDRWNTMLYSPDLKKIAINTPELDRMVANTSHVFGNYAATGQLPPPYREEPVPVQGPSTGQYDGEQVTRSFIQALREVHEQNDFKSDTFNVPATTTSAVSVPNYSESYAKPAVADTTWSNFAPPASSYGYNPMLQAAPTYMTSQPSYIQPEQVPQYDMPEKAALDTYIPDPNQIDKLNLTTAEKLNIYSQIPIHEVGDPELQERLKSERKKMRNRIAASKCRKRKLQKEAELEEKVNILKKKNTDLSSQLLGLREEVKELKVKIMSHVHAGCNIKTFSQELLEPQQTLNSMSQSTLHITHPTTTVTSTGHVTHEPMNIV